MEQDSRNTLEGWNFSEDEIASSIRLGRMLNPSIDLTNACNLNCPYCYIEEKDSVRKLRRPDELTHEEISTVLRDLRACGAKTINIVGAGEPTIDPHFEETIDEIHSLGMTTVLFTNGIRLASDHNLIHFLYSHSTSVVLKYNSPDARVQDVVAGSAGYTVKRDQALNHLFDAGFKAHLPTRLGIDTIAFKGNIDELASIHRWCRDENIFPICGEYIPTGRTAAGTFNGLVSLQTKTAAEREFAVNMLQPLGAEERGKLVRSFAQIDHDFNPAKPISRPSAYAYFGGSICTQILGLYIDIGGNVWPCVARSMRIGGRNVPGCLGNIRNGDKLSELWENNRYLQEMRKSYTGACPYKPSLSLERAL